MATRSIIAKVQNDGTVKAAYCHWDGYYNHVGKLLVHNYTNDDTIDQLIDLGGFSSLDETVEETATTQYKDSDMHVHVNSKEELLIPEGLMGAEYTYIRERGFWFMFDHANESYAKLEDLA